MRPRPLVAVGFLYMLLLPAEVRAEWRLTPFIGVAFGAAVAEAPKLDVGASGGWMGRVLGIEVDVSHRPGFYEVTDVPDFLVSESSVTTVMVNGIVGLPSGRLGRVRPYGTGGAGWIRSRIGGDSTFIRANESHAGINVGGGVLGDVTDHLGVRGDVRYFRSLQTLDGESEFFNLGSDKISFWRATVGLTVRF